MAPQRPTEHRWQWFLDKVLPQLFVALVLAVSGGMWLTYTTVNLMVSKLDSQARDISEVRADIARVEDNIKRVEANSVTRSEILETMKRIEQQMRIAMLEAGVRLPKDFLSQ
jgi:sensor histidine kinase YesM